MEETETQTPSVVDMLINDAPASEVSDAIKNILMQKAMDRVEVQREPIVSNMFNLDVEQEEE
jgi:hypothetical protein